MRNEHTIPLLSQPISKMEMDRVEQRYVTRITWYLEHVLHCEITPLVGREGFLIHFPEGTVEETYGGQSTQWVRRTTIRLPGGQTLQKYVSAPLNPTLHGQTMLTFPTSILEGPEPRRHKRKKA
ncbi:MAG TPA: hypothetical protein VHD63_11640 [Ktedonobacteraceae bacterium]|nr:hypothetical protein [Ktedonobacteraceae bacterium]